MQPPARGSRPKHEIGHRQVGQDLHNGIVMEHVQSDFPRLDSLGQPLLTSVNVVHGDCGIRQNTLVLLVMTERLEMIVWVEKL